MDAVTDSFPADDHLNFSVERADPRKILFVYEARGRNGLLYYQTALDSSAVQALEQQEKSPCPQAVTSLQVSGRRALHAVVYLDEARVDLTGGRSGEAVFLGRTSDGWRISAAGCTPKGEEPYDCDLES